jgi:hypothetical protein
MRHVPYFGMDIGCHHGDYISDSPQPVLAFSSKSLPIPYSRSLFSQHQTLAVDCQNIRRRFGMNRFRLNISVTCTETKTSLLQTFLFQFVTVFSLLIFWRRLPLWTSSQSSWVQIQRSGFDSRRYQIF